MWHSSISGASGPARNQGPRRLDSIMHVEKDPKQEKREAVGSTQQQSAQLTALLVSVWEISPGNTNMLSFSDGRFF